MKTGKTVWLVVSIVLTLCLAPGLALAAQGASDSQMTPQEAQGLPENLDDEGYFLTLNGYTHEVQDWWHVFHIAKDGSFEPEVALYYDSDGEQVQVPDDAYEVSYKLSYWDEEAQEDREEPATPPLGFAGPEVDSYVTEYRITLSAVEGKGFIGSVEVGFNLCEEYLINPPSVTPIFADAGQYTGQDGFGPFKYYQLPKGVSPKLLVLTEDDEASALPTEAYTVTYRKFDARPTLEEIIERGGFDWRVDDSLSSPIDGFPTEPGEYVAVVMGEDPYYGRSYIDFDVLAPATHTVTFDAADGAPTPAVQTVEEGSCADEPDAPQKAGCVFDGWTLDGSAYTFEDPVTRDITLVASWKAEPTPQPQPEPDPGPAPAAESVPMYRLYNPNSGEHFYTAVASERDGLTAVGWNYEGLGWTAPKTSNTPVYRLYNANAGDHHYTMSKDERDGLVAVGWSYEGVGWYSDDAKSVPLYRQYNPNAVSGSHNYTTSKSENDYLVSIGWHGEGVGWYGV